MKIVKDFLVIIILVLILSSLVSSVGVSCAYSPDSPLKMYAGEERIVYLGLQNTDVEGNAVVEGEILGGSEIASLDETVFTVPYESTNIAAKMTIKVPRNVNIGDSYKIRYKFEHVPEQEQGRETEGTGVAFTQGVTRAFSVIVIEKPEGIPEPEKEKISIGWLILGIVIAIVVLLIIIVIIHLKKRKQNQGILRR